MKLKQIYVDFHQLSEKKYIIHSIVHETFMINLVIFSKKKYYSFYRSRTVF